MSIEKREPFEGEGWMGTIPEKVFEAFTEGRHVTVVETDSHACVDGKTRTFPGKHFGRGFRVEKARVA